MSITNVTSPHNRNHHCQALGLLLCVMVLGLGMSIGQSQPAPDTILLPDSLGPLRPGYHLAFGSSTNNIYVADWGGPACWRARCQPSCARGHLVHSEPSAIGRQPTANTETAITG
jgi:hypothetical protein